MQQARDAAGKIEVVGFNEFLGNEPAVRHLRESIAAVRFPQSLILAGARGSGKYTLAIMLAQTVNCLDPDELKARAGGALPDYCGLCTNCVRIAASAPLETRVAEAITAREELRDTDKKDTRILIQTHPDVLVIPPDPPQLLIKLGQVRRVIHDIYRMPAEARRAVYIFTSAAFMKEAANSLLKILEEPPEFASILLLAENPGELLPTIRSRAALVRLGALPLDTIEKLLAERRPEWKPAQRALVARLAEGAAGRALSFDIESYLASRSDALTIVRSAISDPDHSTLFRMTETYRAGAEGQEKTTALIRTLTTLLEDLLLLQAGTPNLVRNIDIAPDLSRLSEAISFPWIEAAARGLNQVQSGMRRNLLRSLSLDAFATGLAQP